MKLKTPLPIKVIENQCETSSFQDIQRAVNQLIARVEELSERLERKEPPAFECNSCSFGKPCIKHTPSLKETLLQRIDNLPRWSRLAGVREADAIIFEDVEAIINKLLP